MDRVTRPVARANAPRSLEEVRRYLIHRDRGIDSAKPAPQSVASSEVAGFQLVTFSWEWPGSTRPDAPRPDGFVFWTELASSLAIGFPRLTGVLLPITATSHQVQLPPGMVLRAGVQAYRTVHRTVEYGELVQPDDWIASTLDVLPLGVLAGGTKTADFTASAFRLYVCNGATLVTATLPAACAVFDRIGFVGRGAGRFVVEAAAGQVINDAVRATSPGGAIESRWQYGSVELLCVEENTRWVVRNFTGVFEFT